MAKSCHGVTATQPKKTDWFRDHTYERRSRLSSLWYPDELVYGEIGPIYSNDKHAFNGHFKRVNMSYPAALGQVLPIIESNFNDFIINHPKDFEELYDRVRNLISGHINNITGIGYMAVYDISLAIGINLYPRVLPQKYVYIHDNCVKDSAEIILGQQFKHHTFRIDTSLFKNLLPHYNAMEIEDILCCYADVIKQKGFFKLEWLELDPFNTPISMF